MKPALILSVVLAGCVETADDFVPPQDGVLPGTPIEIDGQTLFAQQMHNWPSMIAPVDAATGKTMIVQSGTADTVVISGSADSRERAIRALAKFCGRSDISAAGFDTQFVYQDPKTGDWWFDGFCG
jgi:hypothetical protein